MLNGPPNESMSRMFDEWLYCHENGVEPPFELLEMTRMAIIALDQAPEPTPPADLQARLSDQLYGALLQLERDSAQEPGAMRRQWATLRNHVLPEIVANAMFPQPASHPVDPVDPNQEKPEPATPRTGTD